MTLEWSGPVLSVTTVLTIAFGHAAVRKLNYCFGAKPAPWVAAVGIAISAASLFAETTLISGVLGVVGITTLWDAVELVRQEKRVLKGHAPKNPKRFPNASKADG